MFINSNYYFENSPVKVEKRIGKYTDIFYNMHKKALEVMQLPTYKDATQAWVNRRLFFHQHKDGCKMHEFNLQLRMLHFTKKNGHGGSVRTSVIYAITRKETDSYMTFDEETQDIVMHTQLKRTPVILSKYMQFDDTNHMTEFRRELKRNGTLLCDEFIELTKDQFEMVEHGYYQNIDSIACKKIASLLNHNGIRYYAIQAMMKKYVALYECLVFKGMPDDVILNVLSYMMTPKTFILFKKIYFKGQIIF